MDIIRAPGLGALPGTRSEGGRRGIRRPSRSGKPAAMSEHAPGFRSVGRSGIDLGLLAGRSPSTGCDEPGRSRLAGIATRRHDGSRRARTVRRVAPSLSETRDISRPGAPSRDAGILEPGVRDASTAVRGPPNGTPIGAGAVPRASCTRRTRARGREGALLRRRGEFPAKELIFRVYKKEAQVEVWAGGARGPLRASRPTGSARRAASSDRSAPKATCRCPRASTRSSYFHPESAYYLAALVDYPNRVGQIRGDKTTPGGNPHARQLRVDRLHLDDRRADGGALPHGVVDLARQRARTHVHIFPRPRSRRPDRDPELRAAPRVLARARRGQDRVRTLGTHPEIQIERDGRYVVATSEKPLTTR